MDQPKNDRLAVDEVLLYQLVGANIRAARERIMPKMSQAGLAKLIGLTRASVVSIESGRQRAPLGTLWRIAQVIGIELAILLPRTTDLLDSHEPIHLDETSISQIEAATMDDPKAKRLLLEFVQRAKARAPQDKDHG